jgi:hypothetical protein
MRERVEAALAELKEKILAKYPEAQFEVMRGPEDPSEVWLRTTVDLDDPDEVMDLVIDRLLELQIQENTPVHVMPVPTWERELAMRRRGEMGPRWAAFEAERAASS